MAWMSDSQFLTQPNEQVEEQKDGLDDNTPRAA